MWLYYLLLLFNDNNFAINDFLFFNLFPKCLILLLTNKIMFQI